MCTILANIKISLIVAFVFLSDANADILIHHSCHPLPGSKETALLECQIKPSVLRNNVYIHWYRQKPDQPLKCILYISSNENVVREQGVSEERYEARKQQRDLPVRLRTHGVNGADAGLD